MSDMVARGMVLNHQQLGGHRWQYNCDSALRRWRAALAKLDGGWQGFVNLNIIGDSITEGANAGAGAAQGAASLWPDNGYVGRIRTAFKNKYGDTGTGFIPVFYPTGAPLWTFSGSWSLQTGFGVASNVMVTSTINDTATINFTGTGFGVVYVKGGACGSFTITIDGGSPVTVNANNAGTVNAATYQVTGLSAGSHTAVIKNIGGGSSNKVFLIGGYPINGTSGVVVNNCGKYGSVVHQHSGVPMLAAEIDIWNPALTIIALTANDYNGQTPLSSYASDLQAIISHALSMNSDVLLVSTGLRGDTPNPTIPQSAYVQVMQNLAISNGVAYLDLFNRWSGDYNTANSVYGFIATGQGVHPNDYGHADIATAILSVILEKWT